MQSRIDVMNFTLRFRLLVVLLMTLLSISARAVENIPQDPVRLAVLAFKPKPDVFAQWQPIADYLESSLQRPVRLSVLNYDELNDAVTHQKVDVVVTNPGHYVLLNHRDLVKSPLVTLINQTGQYELHSFGGVIFTRADSTINALGELSGKRIAIVGTDSLGGYQMQAYELFKLGIEIDRKSSLFVKTGMPHKNVVEAVMDGQADAGFVRDSVLEGMIKDGKLKANQFKIINQQRPVNFPYLVSTPLYPEWPVTVTPHLDEHITRAITVALLSLKSTDPAAVASHLSGFSTPAVYEGVEEVLRELRMAPFDGVPKFTLHDFWSRHFLLVSSLMAILFSLGTLLLAGLYFQNRKERQSRNRFSMLFELSPEPIWLLKEGRFVDCNNCALNLLGYQGKQDIIGKSPCEVSPEYQLNGISAEDLFATVGQTVPGEIRGFDWIHTTPSGAQIIVKVNLAPIKLNGADMLLAVGHDVTEAVKNRESMQLASSVFLHAKEGILITTPAGVILDVNATLIATSGYRREELIGMNPRIFQSGKQSREFYSHMWESILQNGHWAGEIVNKTKCGTEYPGILTISSVKNSKDELTHFVGHFTDISRIKEQEEKLKLLAHYDPLTGLPNRTLKALRLNSAIVQSRRTKRSVAVAFIDLDGFKEINDQYGHAVGDELLVGIAERLKQALREGDTLARLGGDEFVAILTELERIEDAQMVLNRILLAASEDIVTSIGVAQVSASIGVTIFPQDASDADQLIRHADMAMYQAKLAGKNRVHYFDVDQDNVAQARMSVIAGVQEALLQKQFVLYYQPKVNMRTGKVIGAEALIRWMHPERGLIPPMDFLPYIDNHPVELELGDWVIEEAMRQCGIWNKLGLALKMSVNVSANQLQQVDFIQKLSNSLALNSDVLASHIELEILESAALRNIQQTSEVLHALCQLGIGIALDDFGTGYSSLSYLRKLPAGLIKIDQSFVRDMLFDVDDLAIVDGVIGLAASFRRNVIAEGVETVVHGDALLLLGCDLAQGYGISRPVPPQDFEVWLTRWVTPESWRQHSLQLPNLHGSAIVFADVGHRAWVARIEDYLAHKVDESPLMQHSECHLGQWINGAGKSYFGPLQAFQELSVIHERVHERGCDLLKSQAGDREPVVQEKLIELKKLRDDLLKKLRMLCMQTDPPSGRGLDANDQNVSKPLQDA
ncbi:MAG TPA: diguanylate cyclase [Gallionella sp.]|nr:diguanylate cyclase [Gallionella sp.]